MSITDIWSGITVYRGTKNGLPDELVEPLAHCVSQQLLWLQPVHKTELTIDQALGNLQAQASHLWLGVINVDNIPVVLAASSLTDICDCDSAHIHGISATHYRRDADLKQPLRQAINLVALAAMESAFVEHGCQVVMAVIPKGNAGAKGFCWRWGFEKAHSSPTHHHYRLSYARYLKQRQQIMPTLLISP